MEYSRVLYGEMIELKKKLKVERAIKNGEILNTVPNWINDVFDKTDPKPVQLVYSLLKHFRKNNPETKERDEGIEINRDALNFMVDQASENLIPLNLYTFILFNKGYVPHYCHWILDEGYEYVYNEEWDRTYYRPMDGGLMDFRSCPGMMKGLVYEEVNRHCMIARERYMTKKTVDDGESK